MNLLYVNSNYNNNNIISFKQKQIFKFKILLKYIKLALFKLKTIQTKPF